MKGKLIVGLGNPGPEFETTYHNVGILALRVIAERLREDGTTVKFTAHKDLFLYASAPGLTLILPQTFMNESGIAVKEAMKKIGAKAGDLIVLHDESDLTLGTYKTSLSKNAAGHKGVESIMKTLGAKDFMRIRIGIRPQHEAKRKKASAFVLKKITKTDGEVLGGVFERIADELLALR